MRCKIAVDVYLLLLINSERHVGVLNTVSVPFSSYHLINRGKGKLISVSTPKLLDPRSLFMNRPSD